MRDARSQEEGLRGERRRRFQEAAVAVAAHYDDGRHRRISRRVTGLLMREASAGGHATRAAYAAAAGPSLR